MAVNGAAAAEIQMSLRQYFRLLLDSETFGYIPTNELMPTNYFVVVLPSELSGWRLVTMNAVCFLTFCDDIFRMKNTAP